MGRSRGSIVAFMMLALISAPAFAASPQGGGAPTTSSDESDSIGGFDAVAKVAVGIAIAVNILGVVGGAGVGYYAVTGEPAGWRWHVVNGVGASLNFILGMVVLSEFDCESTACQAWGIGMLSLAAADVFLALATIDLDLDVAPAQTVRLVPYAAPGRTEGIEIGMRLEFLSF